MESFSLHNQINFAMRKIASNNLTSGMLGTNVSVKIKYFLTSDKAFTFMICIKGTPANWKKFRLMI